MLLFTKLRVSLRVDPTVYFYCVLAGLLLYAVSVACLYVRDGSVVERARCVVCHAT